MDNGKIEVQIIETIDTYFIIQNDTGLKVKIHKSIVSDNFIPIVANKIQISLAIYTHYFGPLEKKLQRKKDAEELKLFQQNLKLIITNTSKITSNPDFYYCHSNNFYVGNYISGITYIPLGCLLNFWKQGKMLRKCNQCQSHIYVYQAGGSILSGAYIWHGICPTCNQEVRSEGDNNERLVEIYYAKEKEIKKHPEIGESKRLGEIISILHTEGKEI